MVETYTLSDVPDYLTYSVTYSDGVELAQYQLLNAGSTETYKVKLEFKNDIEELPEGETLTTSFEVEYVQADTNGIPVREVVKTATFDTGKIFNLKIYLLDKDIPYTGQEWTKQYVYCEFVKTDTLGSIDTTNPSNILSSSNSEYPIYAWKENGIILWYTEADVVFLNEDSSHMFQSLNLIDFTDAGVEYFDSSRVRNMSYMFEFSCYFGYNKTSFLSNWDVSNVTNMSHMFENTLQDSPIGTSMDEIKDWDIRNVTDFTNMFGYYQGDRDGNIPGSSINDITFPIFTLRPGTWDKTTTGVLDYVDGTYIPNV